MGLLTGLSDGDFLSGAASGLLGGFGGSYFHDAIQNSGKKNKKANKGLLSILGGDDAFETPFQTSTGLLSKSLDIDREEREKEIEQMLESVQSSSKSIRPRMTYRPYQPRQRSKI